jgi:Na+-driven multidrug efflux pump
MKTANRIIWDGIIITIAAILVSLTSCGVVQPSYSKLTGQPTELCHKGVAYLQFTSGATPMYGTNNLIITCGTQNDY